MYNAHWSLSAISFLYEVEGWKQEGIRYNERHKRDVLVLSHEESLGGSEFLGLIYSNVG